MDIAILVSENILILKSHPIPKLKSGDTVALISSARKILPKELEFGVKTIEGWGLKVSYGKNLFQENHQFSGNITQRTEDLQTALNDENVKAIFFVRGGYGSVQIIDRIDWSAFQESPKWLIGFSDVTVFHAHVHQNFHVPTLHAAMPITFPNNSPEALSKLKTVLFGAQIDYKVKHHPLNQMGAAEGEIVGGNLSILYSLLGSESQLITKNKILFIEDLDEHLYHIDRMMRALDRAGMLKHLSGIIVGGMTEMNDNTVPYGKSAEEIIHDVVSKYNYPLAFDFPAGHIANNHPLIFGEKRILSVAKETILK